MIRIHFGNLKQVLTFDGEVIEVFYVTKSARFHISQLTHIEIRDGRKGVQELRIHKLFGPVTFLRYGPDVADQVIALVDAVRDARAAFRF